MKKFLPTILLLAAVLLAACNAVGTGQPPAPTQDISKTLDAVREEAVQTALAEIDSRPTATLPPAPPTLAPSATPMDTPTLVPSSTPADTLPAPTNTRAASSGGVVATAVPADYDCSVSNTSPVYLAEFAPRGEMDGKWTVKNTGKQTWGSSDIDVKFVGGTDMKQYGDTYNLSKSVAPGESIDIVVDLLAPAEPGTYRTTWGLVRGSTTFCTFNLTIRVK